MISRKKLDEQLKRINFHDKGWGRTEVNELTNILMPDEELEECVNGYYEAGFALMVATKDRVLLVDKKPMGYLTVEDMRFDMINELDLYHRLLGAQIKISAGNKTLHFTSLNQVRLRRLLTYVQNRMTQIKKDKANKADEQKRHLEEMNEQLRLYLMAAHKQQYLDQAKAIRGGQTVSAQPAAAELYAAQSAPVTPQAEPMPSTGFIGASSAAATAANPFEQLAAAAFDNTQTEQPTAKAQTTPIVPPTNASPAAHEEHFVMTAQQLCLAAARRVLPIVSAYGKLPVLRRRPNTVTAAAEAV
jgi:hypothetical protein